jgi:hypothetical protein
MAAERGLARRSVRRLLCALTLLCAAVACVVVVVVVPLRAAADAPLSLDRTSGLAGAIVTVTPGFTKPSSCELDLDETLVQTFTCGPDVSVQLAVNGRPGQHTIAVCTPSCAAGGPSESATFAILIPVPNLTGFTVAEVRKGLLGVGLTLGPVTGTTGDPASTVSAQQPETGTAVAAGSPVDVTVGPAVPTPVRVPDLSGLSVTRAVGVLNSVGLVLGPGPSRGYVTGQSPRPGTQVQPKSEVSVSVRASVPVQLVSVPDLRGDSLTRARQTLATAGLVLSTTATSGTVATQTLAPGRRVPRGSTVAVTIRPIVTTTNPTRAATASKSLAARHGGLTVAALILVVLIAAGLLARLVRRRGHGPRPQTGPVPRVVTRATSAGVGMRSLGAPPGPAVEFRTTRSSTLTIRRSDDHTG